ncbi:MAG: tubulin-like doman-containing protein [Planctomycetota bacterium]
MEKPKTPPAERLPGYELVECIGAGAYGEVWRANAPGGLTKAIKYVFGQLDGKRATSELKALERVKQVRHPYLLSLERIEVVDGRLIVVSELADASLRDRFRDCVQSGNVGIPRDELVRCMHEAAEALDCLGEKHKLQHLDVKPENLLLLAGHVKVADFGLVKSMNDQQQSLVGGMTPVYAAPEVFQGSPSWRSDQYSLAVMYQELLTGVTPFAGDNAAELTMRHLNDEPDLSPLGEGDRFVLSRALAKSPDHRFDSCVAFAEALAAADQHASFGASASGQSPASPVAPVQRAPSTAAMATEVFDEKPIAGVNHERMHIDLAPVPEDAVNVAEPPTIDSSPFTPSPAVFIGLGGWGGQVLARLRGKLDHHFGDATPPTLSMLMLDTDPKSLQAASRGSMSSGGLTPEETMLLPLRRPQEYRDKASAMLKWISRRWLYNIPRSLRTEGIRPLGRLALLDHARQAMQRVRASVLSATDEASFVAAADGGHAFDTQKLRVYVVSSITGGTGGAMTTDVAYALRTLIDRLGVPSSRIHGLMLSGSGRGAERGELCRVNAFAWLSEFQHFLRPGVAYPGDQGAGLPEHPAGTPVFDESYLLPLGEGLDANQIATGLDSAAEYLLHDVVTPAQPSMDACREASATPAGGLRTFQLHISETAPESARADAARRVMECVAMRWCGEADEPATCEESRTSHLVRNAATLVRRLQIDPAGLAALCQAAIQKQAATGDSADANSESGKHCDGLAHAAIDGLMRELQKDLHARMIDPSDRLIGALHASEWFLQHFESVSRDLGVLAEQVEAEISKTRPASPAMPKLRLSLQSLRTARLISGGLEERMDRTRLVLVGLIDAFTSTATTFSKAEPDPRDGRWRLLAEQRHQELVDETDEVFADEFGVHGAALLAADPAAAGEELPRRLAELVQDVVSRVLVGVSTSSPTTAGSIADDIPPLARYGAELRRVLVVPDDDPDAADERFGDIGPAARVAVPSGRCCLITEASGLSLPHVAAELAGGRRDYVELAARVRTRRDIAWTSPLDPVPTPASFDASPAPAAAPPSGHAPVASDTIVPTSLLPS